MQTIADLLDIEVRVSLGELSERWKSEAVYSPGMDREERERRLAQWDKAVEAVKAFHQE
ncbi:MAG TPA: hypothetical protein VI524_13065 [Anaerolineales bacterium]|nr:hypothetical protein [Anaerolineales bacterium]